MYVSVKYPSLWCGILGILSLSTRWDLAPMQQPNIKFKTLKIHHITLSFALRNTFDKVDCEGWLASNVHCVPWQDCEPGGGETKGWRRHWLLCDCYLLNTNQNHCSLLTQCLYCHLNTQENIKALPNKQNIRSDHSFKYEKSFIHTWIYDLAISPIGGLN